ncbi:MAG: hypothetical protein RLZZ50_2031, partial [Verrucomicrobiota bacterium]
MPHLRQLTSVLLSLAAVTSASIASVSDPTAPLRPLPTGVTVTHPDSNPLRDALQPVPKDAIFKMPGYFLWDPSVIEV